jgi:hypothetical protein
MNKYNLIIWLIVIKSKLEELNINYNFNIKYISKINSKLNSKLNSKFIYRNNKEVYFFNDNTNLQLFILKNDKLDKKEDLKFFYQSLLKLLNIKNHTDINQLNLNYKSKLLLENIFKYCIHPLNKNITFKDLEFICNILN